jgi:quinoprotein glucose dehydrogenase
MNLSLTRIFFILLLIVSCRSKNKDFSTWRTYNGSGLGIKYSSLTEVDTGNVSKLQIAWVYHTGDVDTANHSQIQCNPIIIDNMLYGVSPKMKLFAIDAATGREKWAFNPFDSINGDKHSFFIMNNCRGVVYWSDEKEDKRIFYTAGSFLYAVNALTGKIIPGFGNQGKIDLHDGLGKDVKDLFVVATSPGIIYKDLLIMGSRVSEGSDAAPGHLRAYDTRTGQQRWIFHTIPQPGEFGYDSWEDSIAYKHIGGANCWSGFSIDEKRGILFAPIGSASFDFYGGKRRGMNLFADCLLALDAETGKRLWHFQDVHHDVWDRDLPTPPALVTVLHNGSQVDAVAQTTKTGFVFLFNRETGEPLFPIEEKPVPQETEMAGEKIWPTQPIPVLPKPFVRQAFTKVDLNNLLADSSVQDLQKRWVSYKSGIMFQPPSRQGTVIFPGFDGGGEWGGPAADPATGILYVNANEMPWVLTMVDVKNERPKDETNLQAGKRLYLQNCMSCHGPNRQGSGNYPSLLAINKKYDQAQISQLIVTGRRMMPGFKQLSGEEKTALASFILGISSEAGKKFKAPPKRVDTFRNLPYSITGYNKFLSKDGYPAIRPPWGSLNAINLNTGELVWKDTLGDYPEFKAKGIHTGTENYGGPVVTAGALVFIAATRDGKFRAFNKRTGEMIWEIDLPAPGYATPAVYAVNGKQYIVIACGGGKLGSISSDAYVAFALRDK